MGTFLLTLIFVVSCWGMQAQDLAVMHTKVYTSPASPPVNNTSVLIRGGKIIAVGRHLTIPPGMKTLACDGCVVFAGFWNTHIHFI
jgi:imidazolonepropionase-like amidohydrolase